MAQTDLAPSERGSISALIDAVDRLTERMAATPPPSPAGVSPVNWWDVVPALDGQLVPVGYTSGFHLFLRNGRSVDLQAHVMDDRLELTIRTDDGRVLWQRCLYTRR